MDVSIDTNVLKALKTENEDEVRRLPAHARQRQQLFHRRGYGPSETADEHLATRFYLASLVPVEADRVNQALDRLDGQLCQRSRRARPGEQARRGRMRGRILRSRRES